MSQIFSEILFLILSFSPLASGEYLAHPNCSLGTVNINRCTCENANKDVDVLSKEFFTDGTSALRKSEIQTEIARIKQEYNCTFGSGGTPAHEPYFTPAECFGQADLQACAARATE